ncbi:hypothetical protein GCM10022268_16310 [Sphingomonas cynarae]|uniref:Uncharacterized protein n=1 Tax=Sphingomonas cynarae TaxID=930197 RepID=A0ABP7DQE9_9SPHN
MMRGRFDPRPASVSLPALLLGTIAAVMPASVAAQTTLPSITVTAGGAYSTNPLLTESSGGAASTQLDIRPQVRFVDGVSDGVIGANYNRSDYLSGGLGSNDGYGINGSASTRLSPRTSLSVTAMYDSQILGAGGGFFVPSALAVPSLGTGTGTTGTGTTGGAVDPVAIGTAPIVVNPVIPQPGAGGISGDVGLIGLRQRRNTLQAQFSGSYLVDARSSLSFGLNGVRSTYPDGAAQLANYNSYGANLGYSRSLSEISSGGFQLSISKVDYARGLSSQVYTPRFTYSRSLSSRWSMTAAAGAGIVRDGSSGTNVSLSVEGSLCRITERGQGCINAARVPSATGLGGVSVLTSAGLSYSQRLSEKLSLGIGGSINHVDGGVIRDVTGGLSDAGNQDLYSGDVSLQRQIGQRLSLVGQVSYRRVNSSFTDGSDIGARLGLSWSAGRR